MSFGWPVALLALAALPLLVLLYALAERRRVRSQAAFGNPALLANVMANRPGALRHLPLVVVLVALAAMIVGVARPQAIVTEQREEATVILAMDVSRSMKADDVEPTRLDAARLAAHAFLEQVPEKFRVGVVTFATRAVVGVAPTEDRDLVRTALDTLAPGEATAIGDAVALSLELGQKTQAEDGTTPPRTVLLLSDGLRDGGLVDPKDAAASAVKLGVPVHTILVGTPDGVVREELPGGFTRIIRVPPSPETLEQLASATGGEFFTALDDERLTTVYEELGSRLGTREVRREITDVLAAAAAGLLLVGGALSAFLFRRVP